jgi:hypothetical protein
MTKQPNYYRQIIKTLERLQKSHPTYNIGRHIATALDGSDVWGIPDKQLLFALKKYEVELNMDVEHEENIEDIIKDGINLNTILFEEEED